MMKKKFARFKIVLLITIIFEPNCNSSMEISKVNPIKMDPFENVDYSNINEKNILSLSRSSKRDDNVMNLGNIMSRMMSGTDLLSPSDGKGVYYTLMHRGIYVPDPRFNAFVDGVMVNMESEMKRKRLDPLYFRVFSEGSIEHVPTRGKRDVNNQRRNKRQTSVEAIGGGIIRGLTNINRFQNAEVQMAGNTTLIRSHWLSGPLSVIIDYRGNPAITRIRTELKAVQFDTLTAIDRFGAEMMEFALYSPLFDFMAYFGNRTLEQQRLSELVVEELFSSDSFMTQLLRSAFEVASYDKIIPQFGADSNYYSVLEQLFTANKRKSKSEDGSFGGAKTVKNEK